VRVFAVSADADQVAARRRLAGFDTGAGLVDADLVTVNVELTSTETGVPLVAVPEQRDAQARRGRELEQLAVLVLRLEMAAAYLRLLGCRTPATDPPAPYDGGHY
jgi:hypothetical protein